MPASRDGAAGQAAVALGMKRENTETTQEIAPFPMTNHEFRAPSCQRLRPLIRMILGLLCLGCASYSVSAKSADPKAVARNGNWWMVRDFPMVLQQKNEDCGAAALIAVLRYWGYEASTQSIESALGQREARLRAGDMVAYARNHGLHSYVFHGTMTDVVHEIRRGRPVIVGLGKTLDDKKAIAHYEVVVGYEPEQKRVLLLDPARGWQIDSLTGFGEEWARTKGVTIVAFLPATEG